MSKFLHGTPKFYRGPSVGDRCSKVFINLGFSPHINIGQNANNSTTALPLPEGTYAPLFQKAHALLWSFETKDRLERSCRQFQ
jgi:hypothetical protein